MQNLLRLLVRVHSALVRIIVLRASLSRAANWLRLCARPCARPCARLLEVVHSVRLVIPPASIIRRILLFV